MKSCLSSEKPASSVLVFATISCLLASFAPARAASVEPSSQGFPASTELSAVTERARTESALTQLISPNATSGEKTKNATPELAVTTAPEIASTDAAAIPTPSIEASATTVQDLTPASLQAQALPSAAPLNSLDPLETDDPMGQVNNVSQLSDVSPGDWAFEALRSLVERYGCIAGYPDGTFRGNRALTRYEFAAGLNACLQQVERLIGSIDTPSEAELETLRRLVAEFETELATLGARVDNLEGRMAFIEDNQFSTTTKIFGQAIFGLQGRSEDNEFELFTSDLVDNDTNITFIDNVQLSLFTQLSPRSLLLTSFQAANGNTSPTFGDTLGNFVRLGYESDNDNDLQLTDLNYRQLIGSNFAVIVGPEGVNPVNVFRGVNRIESAGSGPISQFAQRNPIISIGGSGAGLGFDWQIATRLSLQGVYSASLAEDPENGGIFGGDDGETTAGVQLVASPLDTLDISLQYVNSYSPFGRLGTGVGDDFLALDFIPINTNAFGATLEWRATPGVTVGGWAGYTISDFQTVDGDVETINWMAFLNFPDLFGEGNLLGFYVGQPPKIIDSDLPNGLNRPSFLSEANPLAIEGGQPSTTTHWEVFYRFRVSDNISVTPGAILIFNPLHNADNDTIGIGTIRTTFTF